MRAIMDYKDFFNRAVSAAYRRYTFSDSSDIIRSVKERANGMEKNNEKKKQIILTKTASGARAPHLFFVAIAVKMRYNIRKTDKSEKILREAADFRSLNRIMYERTFHQEKEVSPE